MRYSAFLLTIGVLLALPSSAFAQEQMVPEVKQETAEVSEAVQTGAEEQAPADSEVGVATLRRAEAEFAMTGEDLKEIALAPESTEAAAEGKVVISTTAIIIGLLVLILIT